MRLLVLVPLPLHSNQPGLQFCYQLLPLFIVLVLCCNQVLFSHKLLLQQVCCLQQRVILLSVLLKRLLGRLQLIG